MQRLVVTPGDKYARLTVVEEVAQRGRYRYVRVQCECGTVKVVCLNDIRSGKTSSCGCYLRQRVRESHTTHGLSRTPEYSAWWDMVSRCTNESHPSYKDYGGRGINVHKEWVSDVTAFLDHVGKKPDRRYTLDRIDNDAGYVPGNVRWASKQTNQSNRRVSIRWTINNTEYESLGVAASSAGVSQSTIVQWCKGWKCYRTGKRYPPREGCSLRKVYG